jgi:hypothetical protein
MVVLPNDPKADVVTINTTPKDNAITAGRAEFPNIIDSTPYLERS